MLEITSPEQLKTAVLFADVAVLDFWAPWCGPCKVLAPLLDRLAEANPQVVFAKVNVDENKALAQAAQIRAVPTLIFYRKGEVVRQVAGMQSLSVLQGILDSLK